MNFNNHGITYFTGEELYLTFINDKRNEEVEKRFSLYINMYFNFDKKDNIIKKENEKNKTENEEHFENII